MDLAPRAGLNDSGEDVGAVVIEGGATHTSRSQRTSRHAHHAWKVHVGVDAPVWLDAPRASVRPEDGARVLVVPPDFEHATGAVGWSVALFVEPGTRGTPYRGDGRPVVLEGEVARRAVAVCRASLASSRHEVRALVADVANMTIPSSTRRLDVRVRRALSEIARSPGIAVSDLARSLGLSADRLSHLVKLETGIPPRRHAVWQRLMRLLSDGPPGGNLAALAVEAGFADHAHMTRTFRRFLGRAPSEFRSPPRVLGAWSAEPPRP